KKVIATRGVLIRLLFSEELGVKLPIQRSRFSVCVLGGPLPPEIVAQVSGSAITINTSGSVYFASVF
ncbi:MAG: hypothetical protein ACE5IO_05830, partial [Thermoplasmata archaeon]